MTTSINASLQIVPDIFLRAMQGALTDQNAFMESELGKAGAVVVNPDMPFYGPDMIGNAIQIPYFESLGDFQDAGGISNDGTGNLADGATPIAIQGLGMTKTTANIDHGVLPFSVTTWARANPLGDPYAEAARQASVSLVRFMDKKIIDAAVSESPDLGIIYDAYSATSPRKFDYDLFVEAKMQFGDFQDDIVGMVVHPKVLRDMWKMKDGIGRPLLLNSVTDDSKTPKLHGIPVWTSARLPVAAASTMSAVTSTGTTPPAITLSGTPLVDIDLRVECVVLGARGTAKIRWSIDGGKSWVQDGVVNPYVVTAATMLLTDTRGNSTGITLNYTNAAAAVDNVWTATTNSKFQSLIVKKGSMAFWYNRDKLSMRQVEQPTQDATLSALHVYCAAARYKRCGGSNLPGIVKITHN